jgi:hypothetical protein
MKKWPLQNIVQLKTKCSVHGCNKNSVKGLKQSRHSNTCLLHRYNKKSGRIGNERYRDIHNHWRKGKCDHCGITIGEKILKYLGQIVEELGYRAAMKIATSYFIGDHIKPRKNFQNNSKMNYKSNIQTLCRDCDITKTHLNGDYKNQQNNIGG